MDMNSLTQKSQEALTSAQSIAVQAGQIETDEEHLPVSYTHLTLPTKA